MNMEENLNRSKYDNYSKEDGRLNIKENINYFTIEKDNKINCPKCESSVSKKDIYCRNCGEILENIKSKREKFINQEGEKTRFKDIASSFDLINGLKASGLAIAILFAFSLIIKFILFGSNNQINELINPLHIMLFSNLASVNIFMSLFVNSAQSSVNFGFLILLILPIVSIILPYRMFIKKRNTSFIAHMKNSLGVAVIYALMLCIISKVSQVEVSLSNGFNQNGYGILFEFSTFNVLFKGFIISFISMLFMGMKKEYEKENMIANLLKMALKTIFIGYILVFIISVVLNFANINYVFDLGLNSYANNISLGVLLSQLAMYLWAFANLVPVSLGSGSLSILSLFNSNISLDLILLLGAMMALSALIFIIVGCKIESKYKSKNIKPVIIFSGCYAVIMAIIGFLTTIYIGNNAASMLSSLSAMQMGFNFMIGFIASFIYSLIMTLIGYKLNIFN
ncbi:hypothetical protein [Terrisporobacter mayombei]|uniref:Zinc ribbon domain-containing protein n=1 Tax=Terrisporobacter mayombei TaxID=1541 RepID=A0ABY9Q028_9FIRM|nr:hypothetical protein [Terrisporobacter mayombei]MCC3867801.1 hypothetical protein [Terrisporobacter mayombei]WMT79932.1 hypothetical protein TEMA_02030 [Terrisporobacter mayombei]